MASPAAAGSLSGDTGQVRWTPFFVRGTTGGCQSMWERYVKASGHSAYAMTPQSWSVEGSICGAAYNAGSKSAAESRALSQCEAGLKRWKMNVQRRCEIAASK
jgi:hypothetical protein